jgi:hypothetical protein
MAIAIQLPELPNYVYAVVSSYLSVHNGDKRDVVELIRQHAGNVKYRYIINNIVFVNGAIAKIIGSPNSTCWLDNGELYFTAWINGDGVLHRTDGPAVITYQKNFDIVDEIYVIDGHIENPDPEGPSVISHGSDYVSHLWCENQPIETRDLFNGGVVDYDQLLIKHREEGFAEIAYDKQGLIAYQVKYHHGEIHSTDPNDYACITYFEGTDFIASVSWYQHDIRSRPFGPAAIYYDPDERIILTRFYNWRGLLCKEIHFNDDGSITTEITSYINAKKNNTFVEGVEPIDAYSEDHVLATRGLVGIEFDM